MRILWAIVTIAVILIVARILDYLATTFGMVYSLFSVVGIPTNVLPFDPMVVWVIVLGISVSFIIIGIALLLGRAIKEKL